MPSAMESHWSSPKVITCPDCGERYDNLHKRRLIDACGHPRCYSCLFFDKPCPLCQKLPQAPRSRSSSFHAGGSDSEESVNASSESLETEQPSQWHTDPRELHKQRAATLPSRGFRTDNYVRSLYRYDPHASDNASVRNTKERPRSVPSYHKSLENLSEQFWKSVERASSPLKGARATSPMSKNDESILSSVRSSTDDATSSHRRLKVPGQAHTTSLTETARSSEFVNGVSNVSALRVEAFPKSTHFSDGRPRSHSDFTPKESVEIALKDNKDANDVRHELSPNLFHHGGFYALVSDRARASSSDRSSDTSLPFSDSWSESSGDSDHLFAAPPAPKSTTNHWSYDENQNERLRIAEERLKHELTKASEPNEQRKKITKNPATHWVIDPPPQTNQRDNKRFGENNAENTIPKRPERTDSSKYTDSSKKSQDYPRLRRVSKSGSVTAL